MPDIITLKYKGKTIAKTAWMWHKWQRDNLPKKKWTSCGCIQGRYRNRIKHGITIRQVLNIDTCDLTGTEQNHGVSKKASKTVKEHLTTFNGRLLVPINAFGQE